MGLLHFDHHVVKIDGALKELLSKVLMGYKLMGFETQCFMFFQSSSFDGPVVCIFGVMWLF